MRKVSPGMRASLDASITWRASLSLPCGKIDEMSLIPNNPKPFVRGLASYSGRGDHVDVARHEELTRCSAPCGQDYSVAQHGNGLRAAGQKTPTRKKAKKNARHAKKHDGRSFTERAPILYACHSEPKLARAASLER
jgi:hypothetical protein